ncbi:MAG TPA: hypothetical protein VNA21_15480 [Steroidobacteraceae bacterium]|nr:hypothetical protein [Steroidobacteraceae bacterium]
MTQPQDDKTLEEYLHRDSAVSQHYRKLDVDVVPPALDSAVLAQASEALRASHTKKKPAWTRWSAPLALAATVVLGVAIVLEIGVDERVAAPSAQVEMTAAEAPASDATAATAIEEVTEQPRMFSEDPKLDAPAAAPAAPRQARERTESAVGNEAKREAMINENAAEKPSEPLAQDVAPPPATPVASSRDQQFSVTSARPAESEKRANEARRDQPITASASAPPARAVNQMETSAPLDAVAGAVTNPQQAAPAAPRLQPEPWLEQIRTLRREGKVLEADEQWQQFVASYPAFSVERDDLARPKP